MTHFRALSHGEIHGIVRNVMSLGPLAEGATDSFQGTRFDLAAPVSFGLFALLASPLRPGQMGRRHLSQPRL